MISKDDRVVHRSDGYVEMIPSAVVVLEEDDHATVEKRSSSSTMPPSAAVDEYVRAWDGLRGFFTIFVILSHLNILRHAWIVIGFFFGHSGILITSMTFKIYEKNGALSLSMFYHRRIARVIPGALLVIFVCSLYLLYITTVYPAQLTGVDLYWQRSDLLWATFYGSNWQLIAKGEDYFAQYEHLTLLRHFWSLAIEEQYYILWPVLLCGWIYLIPSIIHAWDYYRKSYGQSSHPVGKQFTANTTGSSTMSDRFFVVLLSVLVGDVVVLMLSYSYQHYMMQAKTPHYVIYYSTIIHLKEFAIGGAGAAIVRLIPSLKGLMHSQHPYERKYSFRQRLLIEACITLLMAYPLYLVTFADWKDDEQVFKWYFRYGIIPPLVVVVTDILLVTQAKEMVDVAAERWFFPVSTLFLSSDLIVWLGRISYQTYLWHVPIIVWSDAACKGDFNTSECSTKAIGTVLFIYLFSSLVSRCFEYPMQAFILARKNPRLVIAGMFATMLALAGLILVVTRNYEDPYAYVDKENSMRQFTDDAVIGRTASLSSSSGLEHIGLESTAVYSAATYNTSARQMTAPTSSPSTALNITHDSTVGRVPNVMIKTPTFKPTDKAKRRRKEPLPTSSPSPKLDKSATKIMRNQLLERMSKRAQLSHSFDSLCSVEKKCQSLFFESTVAVDELQGMMRSIAVNHRTQFKLPLLKSMLQEPDSTYLFVLISDEDIHCQFLKDISFVQQHLSQHYLLYISRRGMRCPSIIKVTDVKKHFVYFELENMQPGSPFLKHLHHPSNSTDALNKAPSIPLTDVRYLNGIIMDHLLTLLPNALRFFKPSAFEEFPRIYSDTVNHHKFEQSALTAVKYRVAYLGNSIAQRYAYFTENMRDTILHKCRHYFDQLDPSSSAANKVSSVLYRSLSRLVIRNAAYPRYSVIEDLLSDPVELEAKRKLFVDSSVSVVLVEDSKYIAHLLLDKSPSTSFVHLLTFLNFLRGVGITRMYLHDANHLNGLSVDLFGNRSLDDPHLGYKTVIATLEQNFDLCTKNSTDIHSLCANNHRLSSLKQMLHIIDASYLTCPTRTITTGRKIECSNTAWGYNHILTDGEHPSGESGEFLGINILSQIVQDFYVDVLMRSDRGVHLPRNRRVVNSSLALYTTPYPLNICNLNKIKVVT